MATTREDYPSCGMAAAGTETRYYWVHGYRRSVILCPRHGKAFEERHAGQNTIDSAPALARHGGYLPCEHHECMGYSAEKRSNVSATFISRMKAWEVREEPK